MKKLLTVAFLLFASISTFAQVDFPLSNPSTKKNSDTTIVSGIQNTSTTGFAGFKAKSGTADSCFFGTRGVLIPRMTTVKRNALGAKATSLMIYNTTTGFFEYWDGAAWVQFAKSSGGSVGNADSLGSKPASYYASDTGSVGTTKNNIIYVDKYFKKSIVVDSSGVFHTIYTDYLCVTGVDSMVKLVGTGENWGIKFKSLSQTADSAIIGFDTISGLGMVSRLPINLVSTEGAVALMGDNISFSTGLSGAVTIDNAGKLTTAIDVEIDSSLNVEDWIDADSIHARAGHFTGDLTADGDISADNANVGGLLTGNTFLMQGGGTFNTDFAYTPAVTGAVGDPVFVQQTGTNLVVPMSAQAFAAGYSWGLQGNSGTDPQNDFIGTADNNSLVVKAGGTIFTIQPPGRVTTIMQVDSSVSGYGFLASTSNSVAKTITNFETNNTSNSGLLFECFTSGVPGGHADNTLTIDTTLLHYQTSSSADAFSIIESGNIGMGTSSPTFKLEVNGDIWATRLGKWDNCIDSAYIENMGACSPVNFFGGFKLPTGATNGYILQSDASGVASWLNPTSLPVSTATTTAISNATATTNVLIASATGVAGNTLLGTTTDLTFESGKSNATHIPTHFIVKYVSGTLGVAAIKVINSAGDLTAASALLNLSSTNEALIQTTSLVILPNTGNISVQITAAGLGASSFSIYAYGQQRP